jgi:hypothetical protein
MYLPWQQMVNLVMLVIIHVELCTIVHLFFSFYEGIVQLFIHAWLYVTE